MRRMVARVLEREGFSVDVAKSGGAAKQMMEKEAYDLIITDIRMRGLSGLDLLRHVREASPETTVMLVSAYATLEDSVQALQLGGARDLVTKTDGFEEKLKIRVRNLLEVRRLEARVASLEAEQRTRDRSLRIVGASPAIQEVLAVVDRIAGTNATILIQGESGTGKELIAREIHYCSPRRDGEFVSINCGALPDELLESELFGHMKGSFTGAVSAKKGLFEVAHGGSLLLDEIGETSAAMQVKLLRVLQERRFRRVGGTEELEVDVRVIAATNQDLEEMVREERFRKDLFYRINVIPILVPPLRARTGDVSLLAEHFLTRFRSSLGKRIARISDEAMELLEAYAWPGNARELENVIERAVALEMSEMITPDSLSKEVRSAGSLAPGDEDVALPSGEFVLEDYLEQRREAFLQAALARHKGVQSHAAKGLGMSFRSFRYFARKYGLIGGRDTSEETSDK